MPDTASHNILTSHLNITYVTNLVLVIFIILTIISTLRYASGLHQILIQCLDYLGTHFCIRHTESHLDIFTNISHYIRPVISDSTTSNQSYSLSLPDRDRSGVSIIGKAVRFFVPNPGPIAGSVIEV